MRCSKWLALLIALCLLASTLTAAVAEGIDIDIDETQIAELQDGLALEDIGLSEEALSLDLPPLEEEEQVLASEEDEQADSSEATESAPVSNNKNYTEMSNSTAFKLNGVTIRAADEGTHGSGNCWAWAQAVYKKIWGCKFDSTFEGTAARGHNLLRNLTDNERKLTPENLKYFVRNSKAGATLRITDCVSTCSKFMAEDGYCSSNSSHTHIHSLIIAEIRENGMVTMDCANGKVYTRFYTWSDFCNKWAMWDHIKYIKWPNAPALPPTENLDGYEVSICSETYRVRSTASSAVEVYSLPVGGEKLDTLTYPATFTAVRMSLKTIEGKTWVYGKSSNGKRGWLALTDSVANVNETIHVTDVRLEPSNLVLLKGGTGTLKAILEPADASDRKVTWSSGDTGVATVADGVVTGVAGGKTTITVTTSDGSKKASCEVQVAQADVSKTLNRTGNNGTVKLYVGQQMQLVPKFATSKGWKIKKVSSSKSSCASIDKKTGIVTANKAGAATITLKTKNGKTATLKVKVVDPNAPTAIYLNKSGTVKMKAGDTMKLYTKLSPATATTTLTWRSSNPKVASVDGEGNVVALGQDKKKKTCFIGVMTANGKYAKVKIKVN